MKKVLLLLVLMIGTTTNLFAEIKVQTKIFDGESQPPIVGGVISGSLDGSIMKRGIIVSSTVEGAVYKEGENWDDISWYFDIKEYRIIDCTNVGDIQFWCSLKLLKSDCDYYVRAFVIKNDEIVSLGNVEKLHSMSYNRNNHSSDYANVWHAFDYTLFDLVSDEIINPNDGFYYSTNENPTRVSHQVGTSYNTCYKYATEWNYKLWYYHNVNHCDNNKVVSLPIMTYSNGYLTIEKNPKDADKDITIYYSIDGNYFRPESYTDIYTNPIEILEPCAIYCYAISSDGYISYTNMYVVGDDAINGGKDDDNEDDNSGFVDVCGIKWAKGNLQYDAVNGGNETFQRNWRLAPAQWYFYRYDEGVTSYEALKTDKQVDHFTWGVCGDWDYYHDVTIFSTATNTDISSKMYLDIDCDTETTVFESARYGDIAYWASKGQYRMPTADEIDVLINNSSYQYGYYITKDGVRIYGYLFTTPNGNRTTNNYEKQLFDEDLSNGLFLPFTGASHTNRTIIEGKGSYWSSTVETYPQTLAFSSNPIRGRYNSYYGQWRTDLISIRPVYIDDGISPSDGEIDYSDSEIDENTDLDGNIIGNIYYSISDDNGEYSSTEGCIILRQSSTDNSMAGKDLFGEDLKNNYTGIIFMVQGGGTIRVNAETVGNMALKVKIGNNQPITMELEGKIKASFPYSVTEPTYVYIYGGEAATEGAKGLRAASFDNALKIYRIGWGGLPSGIETIHSVDSEKTVIFNLQGQRMQLLQKGINIINGKKVIMR